MVVKKRKIYAKLHQESRSKDESDDDTETIVLEPRKSGED